jgi:hypothetical protein
MEMRGTQMEILDRYLQAVKRHLPWLRQDDIIAELRVNLEAQLDDKEAELGRKLTDAEIEAWLKQLGPPLQVAARYQPLRYLIGPALFPIYRFALRLALGWCAVIYAIAKTVDIVANGLGSDAVLRALAQFPWILFISAAVVTLVFAVLERSGAKIPEKFAAGGAINNEWPQGLVSPFDAQLDERKKPRTYANAVIEVIFESIGLVWLLLVPHYPYLLMGPGAAYLKAVPYQLAPVWWTFYWCIIVLNIVELTWNFVDLLQERWQAPRHAQRLVKSFLGLIPLVVIMAAPGRALIVLKNPADTTHAATLAQINNGVYRAFEVIAAIVFLQLLWTIGRMSVEAYRRRLAAMQ